jgi:hypothetical protein
MARGSSSITNKLTGLQQESRFVVYDDEIVPLLLDDAANFRGILILANTRLKALASEEPIAPLSMLCDALANMKMGN